MINIYSELEKKRYRIIFKIIPRVVLYKSAKVLASLTMCGISYKRLETNLKKCGYSKEVAIETWINIILNYIEYGLLLNSSRRKLAKLSNKIKIEGIDNLLAALSKDKSVVFAGTHFSLFHVFFISSEIGKYTKEMEIIRPVDSEVRRNFWENTVSKVSEIKINSTIFHGEGNKSSIKIYSLIKRKKNIGVLLDYVVDGTKSINVNFLKKEIAVPTNIVSLALSAQATILPIFVTRNSDYSYVITIDKPIDYERNTDNIDRAYLDEHTAGTTREIFKRIEFFLKNNITQWSHWGEMDRLEYLADKNRKSLQE